MNAIVVQFGLAMMPFGGLAARCPLTSATISGTSGSMRNAEELSITIAPASANFAANALDEVAPAENRAMSSPLGSAVSASSTTMSVPFHGRVVPADRGRREVPHLADREVALVEQSAHDAADLTRCSDDTDAKCS